MKARLIRWWQQRQPREQRLIAFAAAALVLLSCHQAWLQAISYRDRAHQALQQEQRALRELPAWEAALAQRVAAHPAKAPPDFAALQQLAQQAGLPLRLAQQDTRLVLTAPAEIQFSTLTQWLAQADARWGWQAVRLDISRQQARVMLTQLELRHVE